MAAGLATKAGDNLRKTWAAVRAGAMGCTRCDLYRCATQTVFGEGPLDARILFVGEQPGDREDLAGRPFVGPARDIVRQGAGGGRHRSRQDLCHQRGQAFQIRTPRQAPHPRKARRRRDRGLPLVASAGTRFGRPAAGRRFGCTAARSLFGKVVTIASLRGRGHPLPEGGEAWVTVHPSFLLRARDDREAQYDRFVEDLRRIGERARAFA